MANDRSDGKGKMSRRSGAVSKRWPEKPVRFARRLWRRVITRVAGKRVPEYAIALYHGPTPWALRPIRGLERPILTRREVTDVPAAFVADPFVLRLDDGWFMWFEVLHAARGLGEIAVATSRDGRAWSYGGIVLREPFHLSYPYVFAWGGETYMVPETAADHSVRLYRAAPFPSGWTLESVLLTGARFKDPSLFRHGGRWWMFVEASPPSDPGEPRQRDATLRLYGANDLLGPWVEHPHSPVVPLDPSAARPAGRVVTVDGRPVRFAQDCARVYGEAVHAFEIEALDETTFQERRISATAVLGPGRRRWNRHGMHHVDALEEAGGWLAFVDGWTWRRMRPSRGRMKS